jgi:hypothetical protein
VIDKSAMTTMDQVNENRVPRRKRPWFASFVPVVMLLLVAGLAPVLDPVPHDSSAEALSTTRWPAVTRIAEFLW